MADRADPEHAELESAPPHFAVEVLASAQGHMVVASGELDMAVAPRLVAAIAGIRSEQGAVVIDLSRLTFIDSSGLQALLSAHRDLRARGCELRVVPGPENVQRLFEITGMTETLTFVEADQGVQ